jgi:hypothetical protein
VKSSEPVPTNTAVRQEPGRVIVAKTTVEKPFLTKLKESKSDSMYQATYLELYNFTTDTIRIYIPLTMVRETLLRRLRQQQLKSSAWEFSYGTEYHR